MPRSAVVTNSRSRLLARVIIEAMRKPLAAAVVTEIGGVLSHGAIVAREFGIPAVVNVQKATQQIRSGDLLRVDGASGQVTIVERA